MNKELVGIILFVAIIIILTCIHVVKKGEREEWRHIKAGYLNQINIYVEDDLIKDEIINWMASNQTRKAYFKDKKRFYDLYIDTLNQFEQELIKKLTKIYLDEYKSRDKESSPAV